MFKKPLNYYIMIIIASTLNRNKKFTHQMNQIENHLSGEWLDGVEYRARNIGPFKNPSKHP